MVQLGKEFPYQLNQVAGVGVCQICRTDFIEKDQKPPFLIKDTSTIHLGDTQHQFKQKDQEYKQSSHQQFEQKEH